MRSLSWQQFDRAVEQLAAQARQLPDPCGIHGVPRGGLVLAVALSHRLELPLLEQPGPGCLVVDDVYETGQTLAPYRQLPGCHVLVWVSKVPPQWWHAAEVTNTDDWLLFPWAHAEAAQRDEARYRRSRP
jgi:hypoxanthine phosphoribosyltransferase